MTAIELRDTRAADFTAAVALNAPEVSHTSAMDEVLLRQLHGHVCYRKVAEIDGEVGACWPCTRIAATPTPAGAGGLKPTSLVYGRGRRAQRGG